MNRKSTEKSAKKLVEKQVQLPLAKAAEIALKSLRMRLTRSLLTLAAIALAIAFLAFIWITRLAEPVMAEKARQAGISIAIGGNENAGSAARTVWLLFLSLLVCLVGIANAMLMSVMERFREIGTMKCLGALDSFILKLFFLESLFLGMAGAVIGVLVGGGLALLELWRRFGNAPAPWQAMPWEAAWLVAGASAAIGIVITAAAALYPALKAARMEPIAAMRVEV